MTKLVFLLVAVPGLLAACGADDGRDATVGSLRTTPQTDAYVDLSVALCGVTASARAGDVAAARDAFFDRVHQPLHDLARDVAAEDRRVAATLHEAKQRAESALRSHRPAADALAHLTVAAHDAASVVTISLPSCPEGAA